ncbi:hypothetical protein EV359DRAFT_64577 [Lentinula novae-zelandiae]|nr:hypothetical protein EV359DRAFT_64577 [Lentinula novae-zelandiae]
MIRDIPPHYPPARPNLKAFRAPDKSQSKFLYLLWRIRMWVEGTFGLAVLEPWEKALLLVIFLITSILLVTGIIRFLPQHMLDVKGRVVYYLFDWIKQDRQKRESEHTQLGELSKYKEALDLEHPLLETFKKVLGVEHPDTLDRIQKLAATFRKLGQYKDAFDIEQTLPKSRPNTRIGIPPVDPDLHKKRRKTI